MKRTIDIPEVNEIELPEVNADPYRISIAIVSLSIHIFTTIFIMAVFICIIITKHLHIRPQRLFVINCGFFLIASLYDLLFEVSNLVIDNKQITVQTCSIIKNFVYNPIAIQGFVDAFERFCIAFFNHEMSMITIFSLYTAFPFICVCIAIYNTFISTTFQYANDVCMILRRAQWTNISLATIKWGSTVVAVILYIAIWKELKRRNLIIKTMTDRPIIVKLCIQRYYWDPMIFRVFFICCILPLILAIPSAASIFVRDLLRNENPILDMIAAIVLNLTTLLTWIAYICYISHIRHSILERLCPRPKTTRIKNNQKVETY